LSRDLIEEADGPNVYAFIHNNAISLIDLVGLLTKAECEALRQQIHSKAAGLLDDLRRYDPREEAKDDHPMGRGKVTEPGGHYFEIRQRQRGLGKDTTKYACECIKCDDDDRRLRPVPQGGDEGKEKQALRKPVGISRQSVELNDPA
jgi:hypothetical protein